MRRPALLLAGVLAAGAALRFPGLDWGLPWALHIDERLFVVAKAIGLERSLAEGGAPDPGISSYGILPLWLLAAARRLFLGTVTAHVDATWGDPFAGTVFLARALSALWSVGTIALVAAWARRWGTGTSLTAAALVAGFPALVQSAHFGTVEAPLVALIAAGLLAAERLAERPTPGRIGVAGAILALAVSVKAPGAVVALPMLHALFSGDRARFPLRAAGLLAVAALVALALHPSWLLPGPPAAPGGEHTTLLGNLRRAYSPDFRDWTLPYAKDVPVWTELTKLLPYGMGVVPELLALVGLGVAVRRRRPHDVRLLAVVLPLLLMVLTARVKTIRFLVPVLPALAVLAGEAIPFLLARRPRWTAAARAAAAVLALLHGAAYLPIWTTPDSRVAAARWLDENVAPQDVVIVEDPPGYGPPIGSPVPALARPPHRYDLLWRGFYLLHERSTPEERRKHLDRMLHRADWLVLSEGHRREFTTDPSRRPVESAFYADLDAGRLPFRLVAEFGTAPHLGPLVLDDRGAEALFRAFDHPVIQVWKRTDDSP